MADEERAILEGDLVRLKGQPNAPKMTVMEIFTEVTRGTEMAICEWFDSPAKPQTRNYPLRSLEQVEPDPPSLQPPPPPPRS